MSKIKKGDDVVVITGRDKGRRGKVSQVRADGKLLVEGINIVKKHQKGNPNGGVAGGIVEKEMPIQISNVMLWNSKTSKGDRVGFRFEGEGDKKVKVRFFKSNSERVDL
ncbi:LSU ribosomal protein L24P [Panacagrimonas perspica]|uniref:Large ribosomal subunit protein uL24 n=1 Tax=Panacagrimonas perspica TaxID=381431 RepID=A0A4R7P3E0_9GAMM|nr:50S ribosomal protein L24 [Panacagrimonas perspica]TDU28108.1 LSU ribosomal protein L24P [Panacagrimonas perspica]THD03519.1 50S ribosomal protein L24 [Panacagrimonas perspica]